MSDLMLQRTVSANNNCQATNFQFAIFNLQFSILHPASLSHLASPPQLVEARCSRLYRAGGNPNSRLNARLNAASDS